MSSSRSTRSSISPFRSRRSAPAASAPAPPPPGRTLSGGRPSTPSSSSGRPTTPSSSSGSRSAIPSAAFARPTTPSSSVRPATSSSTASARPTTPSSASLRASARAPPVDAANAKENIMVTVRFRPLSPREINKGDEVAWYADGDNMVRNEYNPSIAYAFDKVFGPATTTRHVYDIAAQHVVSGAMEGINGTVFAYGVTSSGKTHTMHGEQKSPGIIPLAVKDVFSIIQDTPGREFLLRVSYLEIYNEVINDLLDPTGQNLRIREDAQGTYVEGIKEEVVLSPAHALSLIASGEEHRHVGSNNFNLVSSRSHTIFTLTIESSPSGENEAEEVRLSQLNLIDLAGSESSKTETTGIRRKEGSYINKSLLTLGTVIAKLTDGKATHIPYRDSKLTRLLQYSLSGHGRISLICTVTPASSNSEETHNTLKFSHRSKHVEIKASQNKIIDEKSLIKKYQKEISCLKEELQQLRRGIMGNGYIIPTDQEDLVNLKLQLEAGQVKLQSRLEQEEEAKAALMGRIQRLTKLILVSTKSSISLNVSGNTNLRRRHSFGEDELAYLPDRKRDFVDDDDVSLDSELSLEGKLDSSNPDESVRFDRRNRKRGMLGWFKLKSDQLSGLSSSVDGESTASGSPSCSKSSQQKNLLLDLKDGRRKSMTRKGDDSTLADSFLERTQAGDLFSAASRARHPPPSGTTIVDQIDLLQEQVKTLAGEVALCTSSLKRLSEQAASNPEDLQIQEQIEKLKDEINEKKSHIHMLEQRMMQSLETTEDPTIKTELSQTFSKLSTQLSEKTFELEIMSADNRILQDQLQAKVTENVKLQETVAQLRQEISNLLKAARSKDSFVSMQSSEPSMTSNDPRDQANEVSNHSHVPSRTTEENESVLISQVLTQASEIENLKQEKLTLAKEKDGLEMHSQKLAEEASYAKELAAAAAVELKKLAEEVTRLSYENAKLNADLAASVSRSNIHNDTKRRDHENGISVDELQKELVGSCQREAVLEDTMSQKVKRESELLKMLDDAKCREHDLENELASMWVLVSKIKNKSSQEDLFEFKAKQNGFHSPKADTGRTLSEMQASGNGNWDGLSTLEEARAAYSFERRRCKELESVVSRLKGEDLRGLDVKVLEELQNFHVEALSRICQEKMANQVL
ncbi:kinesin-like protein KIN-7E, chloroplastic isoform X2 [Phragmites australis]|uniref:kinesin-like protein KIN-7E, chloroplastic isoform X2 n=1 Tax=Phragmites australis TaxID=29695 RepID=UPI002D77718F|nr:kinesin-like protein KIN-7E, chloroplastic isoform X2 [Phragmites australis]